MKTEIPYKDMVKENNTLAEFGPIDLGEDFSIKVRIKEFGLVTKTGEAYRRGPCISIQLYHGPRFLKAISIPNGKERGLEHIISQAVDFLNGK